ncbi:MAG: hypothetical protein E7670_04535 [Ruminococcaceae bacterium]|nr:hypothetical protein [Oscillospiraceae bacterium]
MKKNFLVLVSILLCLMVVLCSCDKDSGNTQDDSKMSADTSSSTTNSEDNKDNNKEENKEEINPALEYLEFTLSSDESYYIVKHKAEKISSSYGDYRDYKQYPYAELVIPDTYEGLPVKEIGEYAMGWFAINNLKSVTIGNNITHIGESAFEGYDLETVIIGDNVTHIGKSAFENCSELKNLTFGKSVQDIGAKAFYGCCELKNLVIPDSVTIIRDEAFADTILQSLVIGKNVEYIGKKAFRGGLDMQGSEIVIPSSVKIIDAEAFSMCYVDRVIFETTEGWSEDVTDPERNALYLKNSTWRWVRN